MINQQNTLLLMVKNASIPLWIQQQYDDNKLLSINTSNNNNNNLSVQYDDNFVIIINSKYEKGTNIYIICIYNKTQKILNYKVITLKYHHQQM